jgi:hypothetical protein
VKAGFSVAALAMAASLGLAAALARQPRPAP